VRASQRTQSVDDLNSSEPPSFIFDKKRLQLMVLKKPDGSPASLGDRTSPQPHGPARRGGPSLAGGPEDGA